MKKGKKIILTIIQIILIVVIVYNIYQIGTYFYERHKAQKEFDQTSDMVDEIIEEEETDDGRKVIVGPDDDRLARRKKDKKLARKIMAKLKERNEDIVAFIKVEDTTISYPVVHKDNEYYLWRDLDGNFSRPGVLFMEEINEPDFSDMNTVIYGHTMVTILSPNQAVMFAPLEKFADEEFVKQKDDHLIEIISDQGFSYYKVFSAYYVDAYYDYRTINMDKEDWPDYLARLEGLSIQDFNLGRPLNEDDKILTLSTCDNETYDGRYAVHAVLIDE